jgi:hypothetical protein
MKFIAADRPARAITVIQKAPAGFKHTGTAAMKNNKHRESGQAIMEMCISLIALLSVFLGVLFIAGLGITNIQVLLEAKGYAEASLDNQFAPERSNIYQWDYGKDIDVDNDGTPEVYAIPFDADDQALGYSENGENVNATSANSLFNQQLNRQEYSASSEANANYEFAPVDSITIARYGNFAQDLPNLFATAACLSSNRATGKKEIFTLQQNEFNKEDQIRELKLTFANLFGIQIDTEDMKNWESNTVYFPSINSSSD